METRELCRVDLTNSRLYRSFKIEVGPEGYSLNGTDLRQPSLRELMEQLRGKTLSTDRVTFQLRKACPPQPREISNLLLVTKREAEPTQPIQSQLIFHRILKSYCRRSTWAVAPELTSMLAN
uniref:SH2 domain-containing protein n=1 Tax=Hucho hucho TaxID=62062 RepID=A0A4W5RVS3_9TELE